MTPRTPTHPAFWFVAALGLAVAGVVVLVTSPLVWLAVIAFAAAAAWAALGVRAARRR